MEHKFKVGDRVFTIWKDGEGLLGYNIFTIVTAKVILTDKYKQGYYVEYNGEGYWSEDVIFLYSKEEFINKCREIKEDKIIEINRAYDAILNDIERGIIAGGHYY